MKRLIALMLAVTALLCGCQGQPEPATEPAPPPTEAPTEAPTEPPTEAPTQPPTDHLHSGIREDGTFAPGTLFIGDSLTAGFFSGYLEPAGLSEDAWVMATPGASPLAFFSGPELMPDDGYYSYYSGRFTEKRMYEGVAYLGEAATAIYFMMGTNHTEQVTEQTFRDIVAYLLEKCPNATVYLQMIPYSTAPQVDDDLINGLIVAAYEYFAKELQESRVRLVPTRESIGMNLKSDGVHLTVDGYECWHQCLVDYARENNIPQ